MGQSNKLHALSGSSTPNVSLIQQCWSVASITDPIVIEAAEFKEIAGTGLIPNKAEDKTFASGNALQFSFKVVESWRALVGVRLQLIQVSGGADEVPAVVVVDTTIDPAGLFQEPGKDLLINVADPTGASPVVLVPPMKVLVQLWMLNW